jgi:hypothetical protein
MDLLLDMTTHDLDMSVGNGPSTCTPEQQVRQAIWLRLASQRASYAFDLEMGIPYRELSAAKEPQQELLSALIRDQLLQVLGVTGVPTIEIDFDRTTRLATIHVEATTDYGLVSVTV